MNYTLREYQQNTKDEIEKFIFESSYKKGISVEPTGAGKSLSVATIANLSHKDCLVIQPRKELLEQNLEKARSFGMDPSVYSASKKSKNISSLTYATGQSIIKNPEDFKRFDIVVIDEAHMSTSNKISGNKVSEEGKLSQFLKYIDPIKVIGLTATPIQLVSTGWGSELKMINRSKRSYWYQSDIFNVVQIKDIKDEYWANISITQIVQDESLLKLNSTGADFTIDTIVKQYEHNNTSSQIEEQYNELLNKGCKSILIFVPTISQAEELLKYIDDLEILSDNTNDKDRERIIKGFKNGEIKSVVNVDILGTGFDSPNIDGIILARNTNSLTVYYQQTGRGVRPIILPNGSIFKKTCHIIDLTGNTKRFGNIEELSVEKNDYTKGWAMWSGDKILTGHVFGEWDMPKRNDIIKAYNKIIPKTRKEGLVMPWGKHKGKSLRKAIEGDKSYFLWLMNNKDFEWKGKTNIDLKKDIEDIIFELTIEQK